MWHCFKTKKAEYCVNLCLSINYYMWTNITGLWDLCAAATLWTIESACLFVWR